MTQAGFKNALTEIMRAYVIPLLEQKIAEEIQRYRSSVVRRMGFCCEGWMLFQQDLGRASSPQPLPPFVREVRWMGHTLVHCPFCGKRLDEMEGINGKETDVQ